MEQDYYLPDGNEVEEAPTQDTEESVQKTLNPHLAILAVQGAICLGILLLCLIVRFCFGDLFAEMKDWYQKNMAVDTDVKQVLEGSGGPLESTVDLSAGFVMPVSGQLTSSYGYRADPFTGEVAAHNGLDIAADAGSPIIAALSGVVAEAVYGHNSYGNYLLIDHGGFQTLYGHCETLVAKAGDTVRAGEQIATCGSTGRSTGPHLHFELRIDTTRIDPTPFLQVAA